MWNTEKAATAKSKGNQHFQKGEFKEASEAYTEAIQFAPNDHVLYSNRSGAYASLEQYDKALADADECLKLAPSFVKGYSRKGLALFKSRKFEEAKATYEAGLKVDAEDAKLKEGLEETNQAMTEKKNPMAGLFGPNMWMKLQMDPTTREFLKDPAFVKKLNLLQQNPNMLGLLQGDKDPRLMQAIGVILGLGSQGFSRGGGGDDGEAPMDTGDSEGGNQEKEETGGDKDKASNHNEDVEIREESEEGEKEEAPKPKEKPKPTPQPKKKEEKKKEELTPEQIQERDNKAKATKEKDQGNDFYKKKNFEMALTHYNNAAELDPKNMIYLTNSAAVYFETKEFEKCVQICRNALEVGRENKASGPTLAKTWLRLGNAYLKQEKMNEAIEAYNKGLLEEWNDPLKQALKKAEALKKKREEEAYRDPEKSEEHKKKGNECFEKAKWKEAIEEYSEALRRDPSNYKIYSNRAACYTKLMDWQKALDDCETCLKMEPKFVKIYIRKGKIQYFLKQYHKALETYSKGLDLDKECDELLEGKRQTIQKINAENAGEVDPARRAEAMKDPEIQAILRDPTISKVLSDMQADPSSAQAALRDPNIMSKLEKLIAAGIVQAR